MLGETIALLVRLVFPELPEENFLADLTGLGIWERGVKHHGNAIPDASSDHLPNECNFELDVYTITDLYPRARSTRNSGCDDFQLG